MEAATDRQSVDAHGAMCAARSSCGQLAKNTAGGIGQGFEEAQLKRALKSRCRTRTAQGRPSPRAYKCAKDRMTQRQKCSIDEPGQFTGMTQKGKQRRTALPCNQIAKPENVKEAE